MAPRLLLKQATDPFQCGLLRNCAENWTNPSDLLRVLCTVRARFGEAVVDDLGVEMPRHKPAQERFAAVTTERRGVEPLHFRSP